MKKAFVIGHPIAHSKSPLIHGYWLETLGIKGIYEAIDVAPDALAAIVENVRDGTFAGGNVTIPHKQAVLGLCDSVDPRARRIGAVNTLVGRDGHVHGLNTDYAGFLANLDARAPGWDQGSHRALVLGAGGAARAVVVALAERGISHITILNRSPERAGALAHAFPGLAGTTEAEGLDAYSDLAPQAGILVNTTSVGMGGTRFDDLDPARLAKGAVVCDIVYTPLVTPLLAQAEAAGCRVVDGLGMLLHQAVPGFAAWFGVTPSVTEDLRSRVLDALGQGERG